MKRLFMTALMAAAIFGMSVSCTDSKQMQAEGDEAVAQLKEWLMIQEDGTSAIPQDEKTGDYFIGADNAEDAAKVAWNLSMGASGSESLKTTLPDSRGSISVAANAAEGHYYDLCYEGHYYDILYNVTGIPVTKLSIVNNAWLENENAVIIPGKTNTVSPYICNDCGKEFKAVDSARNKKCPSCGSTDIRKK